MQKKSFLIRLRNYFITGALVLIPIGVSVYLTLFIIKISSKILPKGLNLNTYLIRDMPGVEIIVSIVLITIIGWLSLSFLGKKIIQIIDNFIKRIPLLKTIYGAIVQMTDTFSKSSNSKKNVVLIEYPRKGIWAVGFATKENKTSMNSKTGEQLVNVFVPTTPNPTSGFLLMFPKKDIIYLDMSFEEASKFIVSAGTSENK